MRWTPGGTSGDIEDRRDSSGGGFGFGGGGFGGIHLGIGGMLVLLVLSLVFRTNLFTLFSGGAPAPSATDRADRSRDAAEGPAVQFVSFVLDDAQNTWAQILPKQTGRPYRHAKLVLFRDGIDSACGMAESATGPFYCPVDEKVYLDLSFFEELKDRFGAPGEFAQAYVVAHEIGHHVQKILGIEQKISNLQQDPRLRNPLSVRLELQADCLAGVWGHSTQQRNIIDQSDVADGLHAAASIGDDRLQRMTTGRVSPDSFTHGTSAQRMEWFKRGLDQGEVSACNTFSQSGQ
jgi:predicted metalloprotease